MSATATAPTRPTTQNGQKYVFVEDVWADESGSNRVLVEKGTTFTAQFEDEVVIDRRSGEPKEVKTGRQYVVSSDIPILPGCLTACIRTGRAMTPEQAKAAEKRAADAARMKAKAKK